MSPGRSEVHPSGEGVAPALRMKAPLEQVPISAASPERFRELLGSRYDELEIAVDKARKMLDGRVVWHINSTSRGGGVAEMLQSLLGYVRGAGIDARWATIGGTEEFFRLTKRLHNNLHGAAGDGGPLGEAQRGLYEASLAPSAWELEDVLRDGDIVYLHDPQTVGFTSTLRQTAHVIWRCHVGVDRPNDLARRAWRFLAPYVDRADAYVFSRDAFAWDNLSREKLWVVAPSIDAFSPKNQDMSTATLGAILFRIGLTEAGADGTPTFTRRDGTPGRVDRGAELDQDAPIPAGAPLVVQVSRWDRLKDPSGVMRAFAACRAPEAHLLLAGPAVARVSDDPEGREVLEAIRDERKSLPGEIRARVHLASLPMDDVDENAAMVNAIQRRADIVLQKSLAEGFGLTVAEAMWKARPVVASRIGGIQDLIVDGESGVLIDDPTDPRETAAAIDDLLGNPDRAHRMGLAGRRRVREKFLGSRHLVEYAALLESLLVPDPARGTYPTTATTTPK